MSLSPPSLDFSFRRKVPLILQSEIAECGLACLAMILSFHGHKIDLSKMRGAHGGGLEGCNLQQLIDAGEEKGLASRALQCDLEELNQLQTPCVLHWDMNHFVILERVHKRRGKASVVIVDPAKGRASYDFTELSKHFTGIALELSPSESFKTQDERSPLQLSQLWSGIQGLSSHLLVLLLLSLLLQVCALMMPYYMQIVMDEVLILSDQSLMLILLLGFSIVVGFSSLLSISRSLLLLRVASLMSLFMGRNLFRHLIKLPMSFFESRHVGDVVSRFSSLTFIRERMTQGVVETIIDGVMSLAVLALMFIYSVKLTLCVLAIAFIYLLFRLALFKTFRRANEDLIECTAKEESCFLETVRGIQSIRLFAGENKRLHNWQSRYADGINAEIRIGRLNILYETFQKLLFGMGNLWLVYLGVVGVIANSISIGVLLSFLAYKNLLLDSLKGIIEQLIQFRLLRLHLERVADIALESAEPHRAGKGQSSYQAKAPLLQLRNVGFTFAGQQLPLFSGVNLSVWESDALVITGPSGSGKSTLLKIMLGLLQPSEGQVLFKGVDIRDIGLQNYRQQLSAVMQHDSLLAGSIMDNVAFFEPQIDVERVRFCCQQACIDDEILNMVMGYNSLVGDMGSRLSGGQLQRLLLARALYRKPKLLFLDEASSHLDVRNEKKIYRNLRELKQTHISVAHRPEAIAAAKQVFDLQANTPGSLLA